MRTVNVGIRHDDDLVIPKLAYIEVISISFRKAAAERIDHGLDLCIRQHLIDTCFFNVQNLTSDWQDCLIISVSGSLGRSTRQNLPQQ